MSDKSNLRAMLAPYIEHVFRAADEQRSRDLSLAMFKLTRDPGDVGLNTADSLVATCQLIANLIGEMKEGNPDAPVLSVALVMIGEMVEMHEAKTARGPPH